MDALTQAIVGLLQRHDATDERLARIEKALGLETAGAGTRTPPPPAAVQAPRAPEPPPSPRAEPAVPLVAKAAAPPTEEIPESPTGMVLETRVGLTWINRIGAITLVLAAAFFFKYAVDNRWIGEGGRVMLGVLAGFALLGLAERLWRGGQKIYAQGLCGAGIAVVYVALYASFGIYRLLPQGIAFVLMVASTILAGALSLRYAAQAVAALALLGAYATPILLSTGEDRPWFFLSYLLMLNLAALALAWFRAWRPLEILAFAATVFLYGAWLADSDSPGNRLPGTLYAVAYYALFANRDARWLFILSQALALWALWAVWGQGQVVFLAFAAALGAAGLVKSGRPGRPEAVLVTVGSYWLFSALWCSGWSGQPPLALVLSLLTVAYLLFFCWVPWRLLARRVSSGPEDWIAAAINTAFYFSLSYGLLERGYESYRGLFAASVAALHLAMGFRLWTSQPAEARDTRAGLFLLGMGLVLLTLAVPIQFSGYRVTMAWALEGAALVWIGVRGSQIRPVWGGVGVFGLVLVRLLFIDAWIYSSATAYRLVGNARFLTFLTATACSWLAARWIRAGRVALSAYAAGHFVLLLGMSLEVLGWVARDTRREDLHSAQSLALSILLALYAVVLVSVGVVLISFVNRVLGLGLIGAVVLKLYLYDVWLVARIHRVVAFAALGALLLLTSYLYSRRRAVIERWWKGRTTSP